MQIRRRTFTRLVLVAVICLSALLTGYSLARPNPSPNLVFLDVATQQLAFWFLDGTTVTGDTLAVLNGAIATLPPTWLPVGTGDFNNDGRPDLVFLDVATQQLAFWFLDGTTVTGGTLAVLNGAIATLPPTWLPVGTDDF